MPTPAWLESGSAVTTLQGSTVDGAAITDGSVTVADLAPGLKPSGTAVDATEALRALGKTAGKAASGIDTEFAFSSYRRIERRVNTLIGGTLANTFLLFPGVLTAQPVAAANSGSTPMYLDPADFPGGTRTAKLRLTGEVITNAIDPATTFTFNLYPPTWGGASGAYPTVTALGAGLYGASAVQIASPGATSRARASAQIDFPAAGWYVVAVTTAAQTTTNSHLMVAWTLSVQQV